MQGTGTAPKKQGKVKSRLFKDESSLSLEKEVITNAVKFSVEIGTKIISDRSISYVRLSKYFETGSKVVPKKDVSKVLLWAHSTISNAKWLLLGVHQMIDDGFLQDYLNEFCDKFN